MVGRVRDNESANGNLKRHLLTDALFVDFGRRIAAESAVRSMVVEVCLERFELSLDAKAVPELNVIEEPWFDTRASRSARN